MMTQIQGFSTTTFDELTISQAEFNEYISDLSEEAAPSNPIATLYGATTRVLRYAFWLANQKAALTKSEFKKFLNLLGWKGEEKKYLKVAQAFANFEPHELMQVEPRTIFQLAANPKKYATVLNALAQLPQITQDAVRNLIQQCRTPKQPKQEEKPSIWRRSPDGSRYCQIPPIHEQETGVTLQAMMDKEGLSASRIIADALALRSAYIEGKLILNPDFAHCHGDDVAQEDITSQPHHIEDDAQLEDGSQADDVTSAIEFEGEVPAQLSLQTKPNDLTSTVIPESKEVQNIPRAQLGWNVGDTVVANQKCKPFYEWCGGQQVQIKSVSGRVGTIQFVEVVRADGKTYDTFGEWIEEIPF